MPSKQQREMCVCVCAHSKQQREMRVCAHSKQQQRDVCVCVCVCAHSKHFSLKVISYLRNSAAYFILWNPGPSRDVCVCVCVCFILRNQGPSRGVCVCVCVCVSLCLYQGKTLNHISSAERKGTTTAQQALTTITLPSSHFPKLPASQGGERAK